jgi:hypothetical protein
MSFSKLFGAKLQANIQLCRNGLPYTKVRYEAALNESKATKISDQAEERYVHTQQRSHLQRDVSKKPDMHPETSSTGINLASNSYALCLKTGTQARYMLLQITSTKHMDKITKKTKSGIRISINGKRCSHPAKRRIQRCTSGSQVCTPTAIM